MVSGYSCNPPAMSWAIESRAFLVPRHERRRRLPLGRFSRTRVDREILCVCEVGVHCCEELVGSDKPPHATQSSHFRLIGRRSSLKTIREIARRTGQMLQHPGSTSGVPPGIGIGGRLAAPPLPHHRAYGSRTTAVRLLSNLSNEPLYYLSGELNRRRGALWASHS